MKKSIAFILLSLFLLSTHVEGAIVVRNGKIMAGDFAATRSPEEHFAFGAAAIEECDWDEAITQFGSVCYTYPDTRIAKEAYYYLGMSYYYREEYEFANQEFSNYIKCHPNPDKLNEAVCFKFHCAEAFRLGAKRHLLGVKQMPRWVDARENALEIYSEIINVFPCHETAPYALFSKGALLWKIQDYRCSVDAFQMLIRRFPKHDMAPEAYIAISRLYMEQAIIESQNTDILQLAELNFEKFKKDFPGEERIEGVAHNVRYVKEASALGLMATGSFYHRKKNYSAAQLYYRMAVNKFPDTDVARQCEGRLREMGVVVNQDASCSEDACSI